MNTIETFIDITGTLPRCKHGAPLADWSGNVLRPACGCKLKMGNVSEVYCPSCGEWSQYDTSALLPDEIMWRCPGCETLWTITIEFEEVNDEQANTAILL